MTESLHAGDPQPVPDVSVLVVAFNSAALIGDCIGSVAPACRNHSYEVLLIDNGDGSTEALVESEFPQVRIVPSRGNVGFATGNNLLAQHARGRFVLLLNPDMRLCEGAIDALFRGVAAHPEAGAWGGVTVDAQGHPDTGNAIPIPSLREFVSAALGRSLEGRKLVSTFTADAEAKVLSGGLVMLSREAWDAAQGFDERYFLYCEEVDLFYRLAAKGYNFWQIADARGYHNAFHGQSASPIRALYGIAGKVEFTRAHWPPAKRMVGAILLWVAASERYLAGLLFGRWRPHLRRRGDASRVLALHPSLWAWGYHDRKGLLAQLRKREGKLP